MKFFIIALLLGFSHFTLAQGGISLIQDSALKACKAQERFGAVFFQRCVELTLNKYVDAQAVGTCTVAFWSAESSYKCLSIIANREYPDQEALLRCLKQTDPLNCIADVPYQNREITNIN